MTVAAGRPHTDAVAALAQEVDLLLGRGEPPEGAGWQGEPGDSVFKPYAVVFPTPGNPDGNSAEPHEYLDYSVQFTCVAAAQEGAEAVADIVKATFVGVPLAVADRACYPGRLLLDRAVTRDDTVAPPVHYAVLQISWRTQPA